MGWIGVPRVVGARVMARWKGNAIAGWKVCLGRVTSHVPVVSGVFSVFKGFIRVY